MTATASQSPSPCSDAEWQARVDLAALFRIIAQYGISDLANGAVAAQVPDEPEHYLVHPYGMFWEEATASAMVKIDADGKPVDTDAPWLNDGVQNLCKWILESRREVNFFVHGHEEEVMAVGSIEDGILPLNQPAVYLGDITGYIEHEFDEDEAFARRFVETLGQHQILISRNHGYYCPWHDRRRGLLPRLFPAPDLFDPDKDPVSMGHELHLMDPQKVARYRDQMAVSEHYNYNGETEWPSLIRMLEARSPDYRK